MGEGGGAKNGIRSNASRGSHNTHLWGRGDHEMSLKYEKKADHLYASLWLQDYISK